MSIHVQAVHGIASSNDAGPEIYFGWPSAAKLEDGTVVVGSSGLRRAHICPWGKSVICQSTDNGSSFGELQIVHNDMIDNRDLGVIALGGQKFAITWFSLDTRHWDLHKYLNPEDLRDAEAFMATWDNDTVQTLTGSWMKITEDGGATWTRPIRVPVTAPHGCVVLQDGSLGYFGKGFQENLQLPQGPMQYAVSQDGGYTWSVRGTVPIAESELDHFHEPHMIQLKDGTLMAAIRWQYPLDTFLTFSKDGGYTWTEPRSIHLDGAPPHLLRHSSGAIVLTYGYRHPGYGQRAVVSYDEGKTWSEDLVIRDDGPSSDLGYPCSIELDDGSIFTVYYQALPGQRHTSILWSRWTLPAP